MPVSLLQYWRFGGPAEGTKYTFKRDYETLALFAKVKAKHARSPLQRQIRNLSALAC